MAVTSIHYKTNESCQQMFLFSKKHSKGSTGHQFMLMWIKVNYNLNTLTV